MTGFIYIALIIKVPERLQVSYNDRPLDAGLHLLPMLGSCALGSFLGGVVSKKRNLTSQTLIIGSALQLVGVGLAYHFTKEDNSSLRYILGFTAIYGVGVGLCFAASTIIAAIEARHDDLAAAQGAVAQARVFGGALGLAICNVIFNDQLQNKLGPGSGSGLSEGLLGQVHKSPTASLSLPEDTMQQVREVYMDAFGNQMLMMIVVAGVALVTSFASYRSNPSPATDALAYHKEFASRGNDTELESTSSVRSLVR